MLISPIHLRTLADALEMAGHPARAALESAGLAAEALDGQGPWVPQEQLDRLMCAAQAVTGDPGYGLAVSSSLALTRYGPHALLVIQAPTLRHALIDIRHFAPLLVEHPEIDLIEQGGDAWLSVSPLGTTPDGQRFRTEWLMSLAVQMARRTGPREGDIRRVQFAYPRPAHVAQYAAVFGPELRFDAPESGLAFPGALLDAPIPGHDRLVYDGLRVQIESLMAQRLKRVDVLQTLRGHILASLPRLMDVNEAARRVDMSGRSLRRHLSSRGMGYSALVQRCQRELAERLLREGRLPLKQIADETGFSSSSCFHRAFRRWHGQTPLAWQQHVSGWLGKVGACGSARCIAQPEEKTSCAETPPRSIPGSA
ncbi:MAG: AraC family transcriptional regulator [Proteobacteria bacterium]|uniref:AraC family transcriptional regulator n=1 Tax=Aquabacterium sp. TaxID=1872578 RepID=UPI0035C76B67|nr:AraC family transcriptional regulator [Pseudomonadota bacterium]